MFGHFEVWKLHTLSDYIYFFSIAAAFALITVFAIRKINKGRNDESAAKRVAKKLKIKAKNGRVLNNVTLNVNGSQMHFDHILLDRAGAVFVKSIGWGLKIYGSAEDATWKASDTKIDGKRIDNPIMALEKQFEAIRRCFSQAGLYNVSIEPLAVFADPFAEPELYLGRDSKCIIFSEIKKWLKERALRSGAKNDKGDGFDFEAAAKCLEALMTDNK